MGLCHDYKLFSHNGPVSCNIMGLCHVISCSLNGPVSYNKLLLLMGLCHIISCSLNVVCVI